MSKIAYWYCPNCHEEVDSSRVTWQELHDACGHHVECIEGISIDRLREICEAEREGRIVVLPFLPGEEVYHITSGVKPQIKKCQVWQYHFGEKLSVYLSISKNGVVVCPITQVYKTREEAEEALKGDSKE